jgi:hypothetical protein
MTGILAQRKSTPWQDVAILKGIGSRRSSWLVERQLHLSQAIRLEFKDSNHLRVPGNYFPFAPGSENSQNRQSTSRNRAELNA